MSFALHTKEKKKKFGSGSFTMRRDGDTVRSFVFLPALRPINAVHKAVRLVQKKLTLRATTTVVSLLYKSMRWPAPSHRQLKRNNTLFNTLFAYRDHMIYWVMLHPTTNYILKDYCSADSVLRFPFLFFFFLACCSGERNRILSEFTSTGDSFL